MRRRRKRYETTHFLSKVWLTCRSFTRSSCLMRFHGVGFSSETGISSEVPNQAPRYSLVQVTLGACTAR